VNLLTAEVTISPALAHYPPGASYGPRTLTDFELVWLRTGSAQWQAGERANLRLAPGDLLLIPPGTRDEFRWDREVPTRHGYVHFRSDPGPVSVPVLRRGQAHGPVGGLLEFLLWLGEAQRPGWRQRAGELLAVITQTLTAGPLPEPAAPESAAPAAALDYVRSQWTAAMRPLTLRELATAACVSPSYPEPRIPETVRLRAERSPRAGPAGTSEHDAGPQQPVHRPGGECLRLCGPAVLFSALSRGLRDPSKRLPERRGGRRTAVPARAAQPSPPPGIGIACRTGD
jgi:hypothetical protein